MNTDHAAEQLLISQAGVSKQPCTSKTHLQRDFFYFYLTFQQPQRDQRRFAAPVVSLFAFFFLVYVEFQVSQKETLPNHGMVNMAQPL